MLNGSHEPQPEPQPEQPQRFTTEEIHRQQRANLALRALDLEAENIMLQQEIQRLNTRVTELETAGLQKVQPTTVRADA